MLRDRGPEQQLLDDAQRGEAFDGEHAVDEGGGDRPALAVDTEPRERRVTEERGDGDVGDSSPMRVSANSSSQRARSAVDDRLRVQGGRGQRSSRYWQMTEESVSVIWSSTSTGMRRTVLRREKRSSPRNGTMGSIR
jgi:hypothetical protein